MKGLKGNVMLYLVKEEVVFVHPVGVSKSSPNNVLRKWRPCDGDGIMSGMEAVLSQRNAELFAKYNSLIIITTEKFKQLRRESAVYRTNHTE